jgi:hypothetical protein
MSGYHRQKMAVINQMQETQRNQVLESIAKDVESYCTDMRKSGATWDECKQEYTERFIYQAEATHDDAIVNKAKMHILYRWS